MRYLRFPLEHDVFHSQRQPFRSFPEKGFHLMIAYPPLRQEISENIIHDIMISFVIFFALNYNFETQNHKQ